MEKDLSYMMRQNEMNKRKIAGIINYHQKIEAFSTAEIFTSIYNKWVSSGLKGYLAFISDCKSKKCNITLFERFSFKILFDFETYDDFPSYYYRLSDSFHCFELNKGFIGFKFENYLSAGDFAINIGKFNEAYKDQYLNEQEQIKDSLQINKIIKFKEELFKKYLKTEPSTGFFSTLTSFAQEFKKKKTVLESVYVIKLPSFFTYGINFEYNKIFRKFVNRKNPDINQLSINLGCISNINLNVDISLVQLKSFIGRFHSYQIKASTKVGKTMLGGDPSDLIDIDYDDTKRYNTIRLTNYKKKERKYSEDSFLHIIKEEEDQRSNSIVEPKLAKLESNLNQKPSKIPPIPKSLVPPVPKIFIPPIPKIQPKPIETGDSKNDEEQKSQVENKQIEATISVPHVSVLDQIKAVKLERANNIFNSGTGLKVIKNQNDVEFNLKQELKKRNELFGNNSNSDKASEDEDDDDW